MINALSKGKLIGCRLKTTGMISRQQNDQEGVKPSLFIPQGGS
jgi:hypothetical protein